jgi:hypothetical protein
LADFFLELFPAIRSNLLSRSEKRDKRISTAIGATKKHLTYQDFLIFNPKYQNIKKSPTFAQSKTTLWQRI